MLNKEISHSPFDIENLLLISKYNKLTNGVNNNTEDKLSDEINSLKEQIEKTKNTKSNSYNFKQNNAAITCQLCKKYDHKADNCYIFILGNDFQFPYKT